MSSLFCFAVTVEATLFPEFAQARTGLMNSDCVGYQPLSRVEDLYYTLSCPFATVVACLGETHGNSQVLLAHLCNACMVGVLPNKSGAIC